MLNLVQSGSLGGPEPRLKRGFLRARVGLSGSSGKGSGGGGTSSLLPRTTTDCLGSGASPREAEAPGALPRGASSRRMSWLLAPAEGSSVPGALGLGGRGCSPERPADDEDWPPPGSGRSPGHQDGTACPSGSWSSGSLYGMAKRHSPNTSVCVFTFRV